MEPPGTFFRAACKGPFLLCLRYEARHVLSTLVPASFTKAKVVSEGRPIIITLCKGTQSPQVASAEVSEPIA
jgi:hypothetical protein